MVKLAVFGRFYNWPGSNRFQPKGWNMKNVDAPVNQKVRRICRAINHRANDRRKLRALVVRLEAALRLEETKVELSRTRVGKTSLQADDPFDKILVA